MLLIELDEFLKIAFPSSVVPNLLEINYITIKGK